MQFLKVKRISDSSCSSLVLIHCSVGMVFVLLMQETRVSCDD